MDNKIISAQEFLESQNKKWELEQKIRSEKAEQVAAKISKRQFDNRNMWFRLKDLSPDMCIVYEALCLLKREGFKVFIRKNKRTAEKELDGCLFRSHRKWLVHIEPDPSQIF